jgi:glutaredoxin
MHAPFIQSVLLTVLLVPGLAWSQTAIYRQVDANGRVIFSDIPMSNTTAQTTVATEAGPTSSNPALPYALRETVSRYPVTLYTSADCQPCDLGRQLLQQRGMPYTEKTITTPQDAEALKRLSGGVSVPLLTIGQQQLKGFSDSQWQQYLSAAGYADKVNLPAAYRNPAAIPMVQSQTQEPVKAAAEAAPVAAPPSAPTPVPTNPAGIIF